MARKRSYKKWDKKLDSHGNRRFCTVSVTMPDVLAVMKILGVDGDGRIQARYTDLVMQNLPDFMPRESGTLIGRIYKRSNTKIVVGARYARFLFFGLKKDGTPVNYDNANPQGTSHWDRRLAAARGRAIAREVAMYAAGGR